MIAVDHPIWKADCWGERLLDGLPRELLRWFAGDVSSRAMQMMEYEFHFQPGLLYEMETAVWESKELSAGLMTESTRSSLRKSYYRNCDTIFNSSDLDRLFSSFCIALLYKHPSMAVNSTVKRLFRSKNRLVNQIKQDLGLFCLHKLRYLCEVWRICGDRSAWLLLEGECPIEYPKEPSYDCR